MQCPRLHWNRKIHAESSCIPGSAAQAQHAVVAAAAAAAAAAAGCAVAATATAAAVLQGFQGERDG